MPIVPRGVSRYAPDGRDKQVTRTPISRTALASIAESEMFGWERYPITYADIMAAAASGSKLLVSIPARSIIRGVVIELIESFDGPAISAYTLSLGSASDALRYTPEAFDVAQAADDTAEFVSGIDVLESLTSEFDVYVHATCVGANLDTATQGQAFIWIQREVLE